MNVIETDLPEVLVFEPDVFGDERGFFMESFNARRYAELGLPEGVSFVQDNVSRSSRGVLRGLHFQNPQSQGKLVSVLEGEVFDAVVDIRVGSPNFGCWVGYSLSATNRRQLWSPPDFAHGFVVVSESALFSYKCSDYYAPENEGSILWNDAGIGIDWPVDAPRLSGKDADAPTLAQMAEAGRLPIFTG